MNIVWAGASNSHLRDAMAAWCAQQIWPGSAKTFSNCVCMGVMHNGKPTACIVYHDWNPEAGVLEFSGASTSRRWLSRPVLKAMFDYPFRDVGVQMLVTRNSAKDHQTHLHRMLDAYGFQKQTVRRLFGRDEDAILWTMTDDEWAASRMKRKTDGQA